MTDQDLSELPKYPWMESRIPARDALAAFVPDAPAPDPVIAEMQDRVGGSRWFPVQGGHRVVMPFDGGSYDSSRFTIESGAWDHEHCDVCGEHIPAMTLCHVTEPEQPYVLLCAACYQHHVASKRKPWWRFW
jgi:hypothetical protein